MKSPTEAKTYVYRDGVDVTADVVPCRLQRYQAAIHCKHIMFKSKYVSYLESIINPVAEFAENSWLNTDCTVNFCLTEV